MIHIQLPGWSSTKTNVEPSLATVTWCPWKSNRRSPSRLLYHNRKNKLQSYFNYRYFLSLVLVAQHNSSTWFAAKSLQSCLTLCEPIDSSPPGCPIPGILQARTLEWVAISFSSAWKWKVKVKLLSHDQPSATPWTVAFQAPLSMDFPGKSTGVGSHCLLCLLDLDNYKFLFPITEQIWQTNPIKTSVLFPFHTLEY